ncbi:cationic peroxidase SPC4 [Setaria viridis]|uniref:cationic peroxidase SPC4 n=1 Tax=Setaria viridis TaxID=4556 RepID=UPI003B3AF57C
MHAQGCDASLLLDDEHGEQKALPNLTLRREAITAINDIRDRLDKACGGPVVSCADILTLAARDAVVEVRAPIRSLAGTSSSLCSGCQQPEEPELTMRCSLLHMLQRGGPRYKVPLGRRDNVNFASHDEVNKGLPSPDANVGAMLEVLRKGNLGLDATDLVALSGAHTIGLSHCTSFENRLFPRQDSTMDAAFAAQLKQTCPAKGVSRTTPLDVRTSDVFDKMYFVNLVNRQGLLTSDQDLFTEARTRPAVQRFARSQNAFFRQFRVSMVKMGQIKVLTGDQGQVRRNCSATNNLMRTTSTAAGLPWWFVVPEAETSLVF